MKLEDIPNITKLADDYFRFRGNRDYWTNATTQNGREMYRFWDDRMTIIANTVATIANTADFEVHNFLTDTGRANSAENSSKSA